jgi:hypothetical protein
VSRVNDNVIKFMVLFWYGKKLPIPLTPFPTGRGIQKRKKGAYGASRLRTFFSHN